MRLINFSIFSLLFHPPPTTSSISCIFPRYSKSGRLGNQLEKFRGGDTAGTALGNCSLTSFFGSRLSSPSGLNSISHKRASSHLELSSHTSPNDKVGEAWRKTPCPHPDPAEDVCLHPSCEWELPKPSQGCHQSPSQGVRVFFPLWALLSFSCAAL